MWYALGLLLLITATLVGTAFCVKKLVHNGSSPDDNKPFPKKETLQIAASITTCIVIVSYLSYLFAGMNPKFSGFQNRPLLF